MLRSCLEVSGVFAPPEQTLFAFLEPPAMNGLTVFEALSPILPQLKAPDLSSLKLPPARNGKGEKMTQTSPYFGGHSG
jgi:hypothetical protein